MLGRPLVRDTEPPLLISSVLAPVVTLPLVSVSVFATLTLLLRVTPLALLMGRFFVKCRMRVSPQTDIGTSLSISHTKWMSLYEAEITCPYLPQMPAMQVPMLVVRPTAVNFILDAK